MKYLVPLVAAMFVSTASASITDSEITILDRNGLWDVLFIHDHNECAIGTLQDENTLNFVTYDEDGGYSLAIVTEYTSDGRTEIQIYDDTLNIIVNDIFNINYGDITVPLSTDIIYAIAMSGSFSYTSMYTGDVTLFTQGFADAFVYYLENCQQ